MLTNWKSFTRVLVLILALATAAACGNDDDVSEPAAGNDGGEEADEGSLAAEFDLSGAEFSVGSKEFTEQLILGHITEQALEATGADVEDQIGLQGSQAVRDALTSGEIDMYWEYLGTAWVTYLGNDEGIPDVEEQYEAVREADLENDIVWLDPTFNDTFALATSDENAEELGIESISDIAALIEENPDEVTLCAGGEFATRPDGLPGLEETYGFEFPAGNIQNVQDALVYSQVDSGDCTFGSVFSTDGRIAALDLTVVEDDMNFFPPFHASLNIRQPVFDEYPQLEEIFGPIGDALDEDTMTALNAQVDVDGMDPAEVAESFLTEQGFISG